MEQCMCTKWEKSNSRCNSQRTATMRTMSRFCAPRRYLSYPLQSIPHQCNCLCNLFQNHQIHAKAEELRLAIKRKMKVNRSTGSKASAPAKMQGYSAGDEASRPKIPQNKLVIEILN